MLHAATIGVLAEPASVGLPAPPVCAEGGVCCHGLATWLIRKTDVSRARGSAGGAGSSARR
jgi:hypothetical protein